MKQLFFYTALILPFSLSAQEPLLPSISGTSAIQYSVLITEIMADPDPSNGLPLTEFVELYNNSPDTINLAGWILFEGSSRVLPAVNLNPGAYIIVCPLADTGNFTLYGNCAGISSMSLTNGGEKIAIRDPSGFPVDSVIYSDSWYGSGYKKDGGWSLERVDVNYTCPTALNWKPSINPYGGTPGQTNSVAGPIIDHTPPVLLRAFCIDSTTIVLIFNEPIDPSTVTILTNYHSPELLGISGATLTGLNNEKIIVHLSSIIAPSTIYHLIAEGISDCSGNTISAGSAIRFGLPDTIQQHNIIFNEILFDPFAGSYDFVELYNNGTLVYDLASLKISNIDAATKEPISLKLISDESYLIFPGDYVVLTENPVSVADFYKSPYPFQFIAVANFPSMNIDAGYIGIFSNGNSIDEFQYTDDFHFKLLNDTKGISLEKINPGFNAMSRSSWHSSSTVDGFATPGYRNSQYTEMVASDKSVTVTPEIFSPDNDGYDDYVTFSVKAGTPGYLSNFWIYNAYGQVVFDNSINNLTGTSEIFRWDGIDATGNRAPVGIYVAVIELFNLTGTIKKYKLPLVLATKN